MSTIIFLLASYGVYFVMAQASITTMPRQWLRSNSDLFDAMLTCPFCAGFWAGVITAAPYHGVGDCVFYGLASASTCLFIETVYEVIDVFKHRIDKE